MQEMLTESCDCLIIYLMKIQLQTHLPIFYAANNPSENRDIKQSITVNDFDVVEGVKKSTEQISFENKENNQNTFYNWLLNQVSNDYKSEFKAKHLRAKKITKSIKHLTIENLKTINSECSTEELLNFHLGKSTQADTIPFVYLFRKRKKMLSINSYIQELVNVLGKFPQVIENIVFTRDTKTGLMPSLFLSKETWNILLDKIFKEKKEITDILKEEVKRHPSAYPKNVLKNIDGTVSENQKLKKSKKRLEIIEPIQTQKPEHAKPRKKYVSPALQIKNFFDNKIVKLDELSEYISSEEQRGNMFWHVLPYKNTKEPLLFTLLDVIATENDSNLVDKVLKTLSQNATIDYNVQDSNGIPIFGKILELQNEKIIDLIKDKIIVYHPIFDKIAKNINNESFLSKVKGCNMYFANADKAVKEKSVSKIEKIFSNLNSVFYTREKSGKFFLKSLINTKDEDFIMSFWGKYSHLLPIKSGSIISDFIRKNALYY